jgi:hypothetical protein
MAHWFPGEQNLHEEKGSRRLVARGGGGGANDRCQPATIRPTHPYPPHKCVSIPRRTFSQTVSNVNLKTTDEFRYDGLPISQVDGIGAGASLPMPDRVATPEPDTSSAPRDEGAGPNQNAFHFSFGSSGGQGQHKVESRPPPSCMRNQRPPLFEDSSSQCFLWPSKPFSTRP